MKIGFGTVLWGRRIDDLDYLLKIVSACGYQGVEFAQHHDQIFVRREDGKGVREISGIDELLQRLEENNLELVGLVSGTLQERMNFLDGHTRPYLYLDRLPHKDEVQQALHEGYTLALHPHWLMPLRRQSQALKWMERFKGTPHEEQVRLLLDTGHAVISEEDPEQIARVYHKKLAGVHLKSWRPDYGRWSHRYAHGFCLPGGGIVPVEKVMQILSEVGFPGWVIAEQDHYHSCREDTALQYAQWLGKNGGAWGGAIRPNVGAVKTLMEQSQANPYFEPLAKMGIESWVMDQINGRASVSHVFDKLPAATLSGPLSELLLGRELSRRVSHSADPNEFYSIVCQTLRKLLGSACVKIWSFNPMIEPEGEFCLLGVDAPGFDLNGCKTIISTASSLAGSILSNPKIAQYDLRDEKTGLLFADQKWLGMLREKSPWLVILPVFNTSNPHQLRYLISAASATPLLSPFDCRTFDREASLPRLGQLDALSWIVAHWADYLTDEICSAAAGHTNHLCGDSQHKVIGFVDSLAAYLQEAFGCNQVTIFLEDITGKRLQPVGSSDSKLDWPDSKHYYSITDENTHTWRAWRAREMVFSSSATAGIAREKRAADDAGRDEILFAPLARRGGKCHGVVRLHNKRQTTSGVSAMFTDDDAAKLDAIIQTALPRLELIQEQERQLQSLARMVHEFQVPLVAIRGAVDLMQSDLNKAGLQSDKIFRRDFPDDVLQWAELMGRLTQNARIFANGPSADTLRPRRTLLVKEVVMPVIRQISPLVPPGVRLDCHQEELLSIPPLWIDRNQMQQVFFNLLSNSIKYGGSSYMIRVLITGGPVGHGYSIFFQDWGSGIAEEEKENVFYPGFRGERAALLDVSGQGIGLHVVRSIVEAHGGSIHVRSCRNPTTFEIFLPQLLKYRPPESKNTSKFDS
jgi:signal transduction histidine kinase/sugar phosphate isomerase/epimerase